MDDHVEFLDLGATYRELRTEIDEAFRRVMTSGWYVLGPELEAFEQEWAAACGAGESVGVACGLDALSLSLRALDVGEGDEVIVPTTTFVATWLAVTAVGARVVPVEPEVDTFLIDPTRIDDACTSRTKAIVPVHLYGLPCDMDAIGALAAERDLRLVVDAAQAHGAQIDGRGVGAMGDLVTWSFYPAKNLGAFGDGGAVSTDDPVLADRVRVLRNYGAREKYRNEVLGVNSRLDELQAALLRVKLGVLDAWTERRRAVAERYLDALGGLEWLTCPVQPPGRAHAWHLFVVRCADRDGLMAHLAARGIPSMVHYPIPPHRQEAYRGAGFGADDFPIAQRMHDEVLSLPMGPHLAASHQDLVIEAVLGFQPG